MKKRIFFAMLISAFAAGAFLVSCEDDDDDATCTCTEYDKLGETDPESGKVKLKDFGASNCDELEDLMEDEDYYYICE